MISLIAVFLLEVFVVHDMSVCVFVDVSSGGWWTVKSFGELTGTVAIEMHKKSFIHALDTGLFTVGAPHKGADSVCFIKLLKPGLWRQNRSFSFALIDSQIYLTLCFILNLF